MEQRSAIPATAVRYRVSAGLPALLERLQLSLLLTTYQAGQVVSLGTHRGALRVGFTHFDLAMGLCRTPNGVAVGCRDAVWQLPATLENAALLHPPGEIDVGFLARHSHHCGPVLGHDLACDGERLWLVNTLFNGLVTIEGSWSFVPRWQPPFIQGWSPGDRCHLNGLALAEDGSGPAWVTLLAETDEPDGWRQQRLSGGCLIDPRSNRVLLRGLCMPHSPRLHEGGLYVLESGHGSLLRVDPATGAQERIARLPGFTRGLDCAAGHAFVGLSQLREAGVFAGLPLQAGGEPLRCGVAVVDLARGTPVELFWFESGISEVFALTVLPGVANPAVIGHAYSPELGANVWWLPPRP